MKKKVYAYLHTHWDREWYRDKEDFNIRLLEVFDIVIDELVNNRAPFFYFDGQTSALNDYLKYREDKKDAVLKLIKEKKLAIGPYFVSADSYLMNFTSMLKNLEFGLKQSKKFNQKEFIGYMSDLFGISKSAFLALDFNSIDKAIIWRGVNPKKINNNCNFLYDNIKTTWLAQGYFNDFCHNKNIEGLKKYLDKISKYSPDNLLLPIGADHLGMLKNASKTIVDINKRLDDYEIILTSPFEYFKNNKFEYNFKGIEFLDNSDTYILQGVYSARIYQKIQSFKIQNKLSRILEPLNYFLKADFNKNIDIIYETLLKNYAHDGIYGCSLDSVACCVDYRFKKCDLAIEALIKKIIGDFKKKRNIKGICKDKIGLFNLSNNNLKVVKIKLPYVLKNAQIVEKSRGFEDSLLYDCYKIPVTEDIKDFYTQLVEVSNNESFSFRSVKIKKPKKEVFVSNSSIENKFIKLAITKDKIFIFDKIKNNKYELKLTDIKDRGDSYNFAPFGDYKVLKPINSSVLYDGEIESALRLDFKNIKTDVVLDNHTKFLKFKTKINNKTKNHKLQVVLVLNDEIKKTVAGDAIGVITRTHDPNYKMQDYMPAARPIELKTNSYPMQNFVSSNGAIIMTKGLNEYEIYKNELRICLLRCFETISNPKNPARSIPAGPNLKTPEGQCLREIEEEFAILFGNSKTAFNNLDIFFKNYVTIEGSFKDDININFSKIKNNEFIYGINSDKLIIYDIKEDKIFLK